MSATAPAARSPIDMSALDETLQEEIAKFGSPKEFHLALWRQEPDATGSNWNARIERIKGETERRPKWWNVVPKLRRRYNLSD